MAGGSVWNACWNGECYSSEAATGTRVWSSAACVPVEEAPGTALPACG